ncbi:DUF998 domain-containing protein [Streptomyces sp. ISL-43]|uniref:DUF998 domain-containing protein n=1 Tax=Streptomyces sp. ISL-43 TaxID=2819183 RepID=UPI0035A980AA
MFGPLVGQAATARVRAQVGRRGGAGGAGAAERPRPGAGRIGMIAAGAFVMDPADGFPVGTPYGMPASLSRHSYAHFAAGSVTFTALIAACYVLGRHFGRAGNRGRALTSRVAGTAPLLGNGWAMSGGEAGTLTLAIGVITAMARISATAFRYRRGL